MDGSINWELMSADEAEALAAGMYAGEKKAAKEAKAQRAGHDKTMDYWWTFIAHIREVIQWYNPTNQPTLEDCVLAYERQTEKAFNDILNAGGAGSAEATAAHAEWMVARTQRATMDADEKCVDENPTYLSIAF